MKILFMNFYNDEAYGVRILHSILSQRHDCKMLFVKENNRELVVETILNIRPDVLCVSLTSPNLCLYKTLYVDIRAAMKEGVIVLGGWHPTLKPESCEKYCNIVCRGECEDKILNIMEDIKNKSYLKVYSFSPLCRDVNHVPLLFDDKYCISVENNNIIYGDPYSRNERYGTMISRGCCYSCSYCSNSFMKGKYKGWTKIRHRDFDKVLDELRIVREVFPNIKRINFYDEIFLKLEGYESFLQTYGKEINLPFYCMFYPGTASEDMIVKLKDAGLEGVWLGVQSGSERVRREVFGRKYSNENLLKQIDIFKKHDVNVRYDFIFDNPFETKEEYRETIDLIRQLPKPYSINMFKLKYFPNTEITKMAIKGGYLVEEDDEIDYEDPSYSLSDERREEVLRDIESL